MSGEVLCRAFLNETKVNKDEVSRPIKYAKLAMQARCLCPLNPIHIFPNITRPPMDLASAKHQLASPPESASRDTTRNFHLIDSLSFKRLSFSLIVTIYMQ